MAVEKIGSIKADTKVQIDKDTKAQTDKAARAQTDKEAQARMEMMKYEVDVAHKEASAARGELGELPDLEANQAEELRKLRTKVSIEPTKRRSRK